MSETFLQTVPILRIFSEEKAKEFYVGFLGFKIDWEHRFGENFPIYMQASRGPLVLHLSEHHGDCCPGAKVMVWMTGIEAYHGEITSKDYRYMKPGIQKTFYGSKCVEVVDPFGNRISFNERLENEEAKG